MARDVDAVGIGHADPLAGQSEDVGDEAAGGGFAVRAGDGDDRDAAVFMRCEERLDDGFADRAAPPV